MLILCDSISGEVFTRITDPDQLYFWKLDSEPGSAFE
jgi:hypothetical protein